MLEAGPDMNPILFYLGLRCAPYSFRFTPNVHTYVVPPAHDYLAPAHPSPHTNQT